VALLAGTSPPELYPVLLALGPAGLGMGGGGAWDPHTVRGWPEQDAEDALLVIGTMTNRRGTPRGGEEY